MIVKMAIIVLSVLIVMTVIIVIIVIIALIVIPWHNARGLHRCIAPENAEDSDGTKCA